MPMVSRKVKAKVREYLSLQNRLASMRENWIKASGFTRGAGSVTQTTKLVTPNGFTIEQDSSGNIGLFIGNTEVCYIDKYGNVQFIGPATPPTGSNAIGSDGFSLWLNTPNAVVLSNGSTVNFNFSQLALTTFGRIPTKGLGLGALFGLDNRTGRTAADGAAITLYTGTGAGQLYRINARAFATVGTSATYIIQWTEGGVVNSKTLSITALDTEVTQNFLIQPDNATAITAQITAISGTTLNVACSVEELA